MTTSKTIQLDDDDGQYFVVGWDSLNKSYFAQFYDPTYVHHSHLIPVRAVGWAPLVQAANPRVLHFGNYPINSIAVLYMVLKADWNIPMTKRAQANSWLKADLEKRKKAGVKASIEQSKKKYTKSPVKPMALKGSKLSVNVSELKF